MGVYFYFLAQKGTARKTPKTAIGLSRQALEVINNNTVEHLVNGSGRNSQLHSSAHSEYIMKLIRLYDQTLQTPSAL